mgnify:FL=1
MVFYGFTFLFSTFSSRSSLIIIPSTLYNFSFEIFFQQVLNGSFLFPFFKGGGEKIVEKVLVVIIIIIILIYMNITSLKGAWFRSAR